jgi:hypothetical protein
VWDTDAFTIVLNTAVGAGNWVFVAAVSGVGAGYVLFDGGRQRVQTACELRDGSGNFLGGGSAAGEVSDEEEPQINDYHTITLNGGISVPPDSSKVIQVWCRAEGGGAIDGVQMVILEVGSFF